MIVFKIIENEELNVCINSFDAKTDYLRKQFNIELKTYGNIIRIALNTIQTEAFDNLIERVKVNKELERALDYIGGYTIDFISENNPKTALIEFLTCLKNRLLKKNALLEFLQNTEQKKTVLIADLNDIDYLKQYVRNKKVNIIPFARLKKTDISNKTLIFYSFNGAKDFELIYDIKAEVVLIIYEQEDQLYKKQVRNRKQLIEEEIKGNDRLKISGIEYADVSENPIHISKTIDDIVSRLDNLGYRAYAGYKDESDVLLDEIDEKIIYKLSAYNLNFYLDSNDTIFTNTGDLKKIPNIKIGDTIRIYPKEQLAENLYQVAVETEPDIFGKIEGHSKCWNMILEELNKVNDIQVLHEKLKGKGLRVLQNTVEGYLKGFRKFPMFNNDLRAIFRLYYPEKSEAEIDVILAPILKSKTTYNSTMIALGRGLKQELRAFLKEKRIGEILEKRKFTCITLQTFIDEYMPLHAITNKEVCTEDGEQADILYFRSTTIH